MSSNIAKHAHGRPTHLLLKTTGLKVEDMCLTVSPLVSPLLTSARWFVDFISGTAEVPQGGTQKARGSLARPDSWVFYFL